MLGCLRALDAALRERGSGLVVRHGSPERRARRARARGRRAGGAVDERRRAVRPRPRPPRDASRSRDAGVRGAAAGRRVRRRRLQAAHAGRQAVHGLQPRFTAAGCDARAAHDPPRARRASARCRARCARAASRRSHALGLDGADARRAVLRARRARRARGARALARRRRSTPTPRRTTSLADERGTSGLSPYLRWGCLSAAECEQRAARRGGDGRARLGPPARAGATSTPTSCSRTPTTRATSSRRATASWSGCDDDDALEAWRERPHRLSARRRRRCASSPARAGCTTARGSSSARFSRRTCTSTGASARRTSRRCCSTASRPRTTATGSG